jgi:hypothetical protein
MPVFAGKLQRREHPRVMFYAEVVVNNNSIFSFNYPSREESLWGIPANTGKPADYGTFGKKTP